MKILVSCGERGRAVSLLAVLGQLQPGDKVGTLEWSEHGLLLYVPGISTPAICKVGHQFAFDVEFSDPKPITDGSGKTPVTP